MKIIMYGAPICEDCVNAKQKLMESNEVELDYKNIIESTSIMKEFLQYRDNEELFKDIKKAGKIGIPFFILEHGEKTLDIEKYIDIDLEKANVKNVCSLDRKGSC